VKKTTDKQEKIMDYLRKAGRFVGAAEVAREQFGVGEPSRQSPFCRSAMVSLFKRGLLDTDYSGRYKIKDPEKQE